MVAFFHFSIGIYLREEKRIKRTKKVSKKMKDKEREKKEEQGKQRKSRIKQLQWELLQIICCMYDLLVGFDMHRMCMLVFGSFFSLAWVFSGFANGL